MLAQRYDGTREMVGFLPLGRPGGHDGSAVESAATPAPLVSIFWSVRSDRVDAERAAGLRVWRQRVLALAPEAAPLLDQVDGLDSLLFSTYHDVTARECHGDRVVLLGDAAHAMSPQLGQGVNLALVYALLLAPVLAEGFDVPGALESFSRERRRQIRYYSAMSRLLTPFFQSDRPGLAAVRDALTLPVSRVAPLRRQMLATLAGAKDGLLRTLPPGELPRRS